MSDLFDYQLEDTGPVECLGQTFPNEQARREHYLKLLAEKLKDPEFRKIDGFPIGTDDDILALSDPPYYTACPNPFFNDFVERNGTSYPSSEPYSKEPFAADVSEGRSGHFYDAHSYHTKVPHKAIIRFILHYTKPGDILLDSFCGTGMTGVAAQLCGDRYIIESLGYKVDTDGTIFRSEIENGQLQWHPFSKLGERYAILNDLSPAATFIASNLNLPIDVSSFRHEAENILKEVEAEYGWMYETLHVDGKSKGRVSYIVWSDVFSCHQCASEIIFWDVAIDNEEGKILEKFSCPVCSVELTKKSIERMQVNKNDLVTGTIIKQAKQVPVLINYSIGTKRFEKRPDNNDIDLISRIEAMPIQNHYPKSTLPNGFNTRQPKESHGVDRVYQFYTRRNLHILSALREKAGKARNSHSIQFLINSYDLTHSTLMTSR